MNGKGGGECKTIKIYMEGGCLLDVEGLPTNYTYELIDYDDIEQLEENEE